MNIQDEFQENTTQEQATICEAVLECDTVKQVLRIFPKSTIAIFGTRIVKEEQDS